MKPAGTTGDWKDLTLLVILFLAGRFTAVLFLRPGGNVYQGEHDFLFYRSVGELSLGGYFPYLHYWMEYPPLFPWSLVAIYKLTSLVPAWPNQMLSFQVGLSTFLALFDLGNLMLVYGLSAAMHGRQVAMRSAWIYALLAFPLYASLAWFDTLSLFFLLLAVWLALRGHPWLAGAAGGLGLMTKLIPIVAAPAIIRACKGTTQRARYLLGLCLVGLAVALPFAILNPAMLLVSLQSIVNRPPWETVWALLEGQRGTGVIPPLGDRFRPLLPAQEFSGGGAPSTVAVAVFGVLCALLYTRRLRWCEPRTLLPAVALTTNLLVVFSKGYSPQFLIYPLALLVIVMPGARGALFAVLLTANNFVEWPWAFGYLHDAHHLQWSVVLVRTGLLLWIGVEYAALLFEHWGSGWKQIRMQLAFGVVLLAGSALAFDAAEIVRQHYQLGESPKLAAYIRSFSSGDDQLVVASSRDALYGTKAIVPSATWLLAEDDDRQWPTSLEQRLHAAMENRHSAWLIVDHGKQDAARRATLIEWFDVWGSRATDMWFGPYQLIGYAAYHVPRVEPQVVLNDTFGGIVRLRGYDLSGEELAPGSGLRLSMYFSAAGPLERDYKVFVHVVDANGRLVAQRDRMLSHGGRTSANWKPGQSVRESYDLLMPAGAAPGEHAILTGVYEPESGQRLRVSEGARGARDSVRLAGLWVSTRAN